MKQVGKSSTGLEQNIAALISYLLGPITGIIMLVLEKGCYFVRFSAMQSTVVFLFIWIVSGVIGIIPILGWIASGIIALFSFLLWLYLLFKSFQNEKVELPIFADISDSLIRSIFKE